MNRFHALLAVAAVSLLALIPASASASQVQPVSISACAGESGCSLTNSVRVDQQFGLRVAFRVTNPISSGNTVYIEAPPGAQFISIPSIQINWQLGGYSAPGTSVANGGRRLQVPIPSFLSGPITSGADLEISIGFFKNEIVVPAAPGNFTVDVWTSTDVDPRTSSNSITTTLGLPSSLTPAESPLSAVAGAPFTTSPGAILTDSRGNPLPGEEISFELPESGPGGSFAGGAASATAVTDATGLATPSAQLTAASEAGGWQIGLGGPGPTSGAIDVTTTPAEADEIELEIAPTSVPADGSSAAEATIRVLDAFGNEIVDDEVGLDTGGGPSATVPEDHGDGTLRSSLTASTVPGEFTITAEDTSVEPALTETATFTQTVLPPVDLGLVLEPASIVADGASLTVATATVRDELGAGIAGAAVTFSSDAGNQIGATVDHGGGVYTATVRSTTAPGGATITAAVAGETELTATARLVQTAIPSLPQPPASGGGSVGAAAGPGATRIKSGPKGKVRARRVRFAFSSPNASGFRCRLDRGAWKRCRSPFAAAVEPGRHVFRVRAVGSGGELGPVARRAFKRVRPAR